MEIIVLQGSPNREGSTAMLADEFARGAREAGHAVERIDVAHEDIRPCAGCVACGYGARPCVQRDAMAGILDRVLAADMVVFATPLYYYGMSAQLKAVLDRFCSENPSITARRLESALLAVAWNADDWTFEALVSHYRTVVRYLDMDDRGMVLGYGCVTPGMTRATRYPLEAYSLGVSL